MSYKFFDYNIKIFLDDKNNEYGAYIEEAPEVSAYGKTVDMAVKELQVVFKEWLKVSKQEKYPIPEPLNLKKYSGKFVLRLPKSLHKRIIERANKDNISLNQELIYFITKGLLAA